MCKPLAYNLVQGHCTSTTQQHNLCVTGASYHQEYVLYGPDKVSQKVPVWKWPLT